MRWRRHVATLTSAAVFLWAAVGRVVVPFPGTAGRTFGVFDVHTVSAKNGLGQTISGSTCYFFLTERSALSLCHQDVTPVVAPAGPHGASVVLMNPEIEAVCEVRRSWLIAAGLAAAVPPTAALLRRFRRQAGRGFPLDATVPDPDG